MAASGVGGDAGGNGDAGAELGELTMGDGSFRTRLSRLIRPEPRQEVDDELSFHLEERVREYEARGMTAEDARAAAVERLGDLDGVRAECADLLSAERRTERRRDWLRFSWLDVKLGTRMLVKYPGLTLVGGLAMAFAIWVGAGAFEFVQQGLSPDLPLSEGDRVVGIQVWDASANAVERRVAHELALWRAEASSIEELGAFRVLERNLIGGDGRGEPVEVAEITATGFDVARVPPLLGRTLTAVDETAGAPSVVVLGHDVWQRRFAEDRGIVGEELRLGSSRVTVVGVMPEGFGFPISQSLWMPLRAGELDYEPRSGPGLMIFGRLAPGASMSQAQAELTALGQRMSADYPETHEHLRPQVLPYARSILSLPTPMELGLASINLFVALLLVLICGNVALLMFARAATREGEILVRTALGASRARIITQLFVEALVLGGVAAVVGLAAAGFGLRWLFSTVVPEVMGSRLPFWFSDSLSLATYGYAVLLTVLAALVAGVIPALKVTGGGVESRLRESSAGGGGLRFGGIWTVVIVLQVAVTVALPAFAYLATTREAAQIRAMDVGIPTREYLAVRMELDRESAEAVAAAAESDDTTLTAFAARFREATTELESRLETHEAVAGVTFGERLPTMYHPHRLIDIDEGGAAPLRPEWDGYRVSGVQVARDFFQDLNVPILSGRDFHSGDLGADARAVIVNESFVDRVLGGRNPLGRQVKYKYFEHESGFRDPETEPWYEIVGVVPDLGTSHGDFDPKVAALYHPVRNGGVYPVHMAVHVRGNPESITRDLRALATDVDPGLRLYDPMSLDRVVDSELRFLSFWFWMLVLLSGVALLLSLAGIYAVMSFAVSRRTREIGIRVALGAGRSRVIRSTFRKPLIQVGSGILAGGILIVVLSRLVEGQLRGQPAMFIGLYVLFMVGVCSLACIVPTRRALGVEPTEALKAE